MSRRSSIICLTFMLAWPPVLVAAEEWLTNVSARATSEQVAGLFAAANVVNDHGLTETAPGSGRFQLTTNGYADGGSTWHTAYLSRGADENPILEFDFGREVTLGGFRVWNHNGNPSRGFHEVLSLVSILDGHWTTVPQRFRFAMAPNRDDYTGELYEFRPPIRARKLRWHCLSTHRRGGNPDLAGLGKVRFLTTPDAPEVTSRDESLFPAGAGVVDVRQPPYSAKGDGEADDSEAIQQAIDDTQGTGRIVFLPAGRYRVTKSLRYRPGAGYGDNNVRGAGRDQTTLVLRKSTFTNPDQPQAVLDLAYNGQSDGSGVHADWFNNNVSDLSIEVETQNPGAIGLRFYSNNVGSLRRVGVRSQDGDGLIGVDLGYADQNGPCLIRDVEVDGFRVGISTAATVNSQTFEDVRVRNSREVGFRNRGQCLSIRRLVVDNAPRGFDSEFGVVALIDSTFRRDGPAAGSAVSNRETLFARNLTVRGYETSIENRRQNGTPGVKGELITEFVSSPLLTSSGSKSSLNLPIEDVPSPPEILASSWVNPWTFRQLEDPDDSACLQRAIDAGAAALYLPAGSRFLIGEPVLLRGKLQRIDGFFARIDGIEREHTHLKIVDGTAPLLHLQNLAGNARLDHAATRTLVIQNVQGLSGNVSGSGNIHLDNVVAEWEFGSGQAWCRQFNTEREGTHAINHGGSLWVLGLKTERGGTLVETKAGGRTEIIGGLSYTTTQGKLAPMFTVVDGDLSVTLGEVCYTGDPYQVLVSAKSGSQSALLRRGDSPLRPSFLQGSEIPLFVHRRSP